MTQRVLVSLAGGLVAGLAIGIIGVAQFGGRNTDTTVTLSNTGVDGACVLDKQTLVRVKKDKKLTWTVDNSCGESHTVMVGNFRDDRTGAASDCSAATEGNAVYPFKKADAADRTIVVDAGQSRALSLKAKTNSELPGDRLTYYFDICMDGTQADPTLMVER